MVYTTHYQSPLGALLLAARGDALAGLWLEGQKYFLGSLKEPAEPMEGHPVLLQAGDWLSRYFAGERPDSGELKLDPGGGEFRRTVWEELCRIPYGSVTTDWAGPACQPRRSGARWATTPSLSSSPATGWWGRTAALPDTPGESTRSSGFWTTRGWRRTASSSPTTAPRRKGGAHGEKAMQVGEAPL